MRLERTRRANITCSRERRKGKRTGKWAKLGIRYYGKVFKGVEEVPNFAFRRPEHTRSSTRENTIPLLIIFCVGIEHGRNYLLSS